MHFKVKLDEVHLHHRKLCKLSKSVGAGPGKKSHRKYSYQAEFHFRGGSSGPEFYIIPAEQKKKSLSDEKVYLRQRGASGSFRSPPRKRAAAAGPVGWSSCPGTGHGTEEEGQKDRKEGQEVRKDKVKPTPW